MSEPLAYFITYACYGTHLHGETEAGVDKAHCTVGGSFVEENAAYAEASRRAMSQEPYHMDEPRRRLVFDAIMEVCQFRSWTLLALHVRTNHIHVVVQSNGETPERVMGDFKRYASRALGAAGIDPPDRKRWARHGSTQYLNTQKSLVDTARYVVEEQGEKMQVYYNDEILPIV